jgi:signal transduction histidine kinase/DNA-binding NarL/FixJ family response regulator
MKNWGIRARVLLLALAPSMLILLTLVAYFTYARIAEVDASLARQGRSVARQLAPGAEFALFAGDRAALQRLTDAAAREINVYAIRITDADRRELARSGAEGERIAEAELAEFTEPVFETRLPTDIPERLYAPAAPAMIGQIAVTMSRRAAEAEQRRLLTTGLVLGLACMAGAVLLAMITGDGVVRPIRTLADAMQRLGTGESVAPLAVSGGGELRTLQEGFNDMSARLRASTQELRARIEAATRALSMEKETAEQATAAKSRFIAAASHDLRQPLHAIGMFSATLERRSRGTELEGVVDDLVRAVAVMDQLFDALLDISRLEAGALHASLGQVPLAPLFAQLNAEHRELALRKGLVLRFARTHATVVSDELLLHRLLGNLVLNAIRYTSRGSVLVCARRRADAIRIEVRDSGIGISPAHQKAIFREFYQVGNPARDRDRGLGLGLAIVSRIARLLGSEVLVRSAPGRGSVFFLDLARAGATTLAPVVAPPIVGVWQEKLPVAVLLVDDDLVSLAGGRVSRHARSSGARDLRPVAGRRAWRDSAAAEACRTESRGDVRCPRFGRHPPGDDPVGQGRRVPAPSQARITRQASRDRDALRVEASDRRYLKRRPMKILLADDHALIRAGLRGEIDALDDAIEFIEAWDAASLGEALERHPDTDLALVDLAMPGMDRERTIAALRDAHPAVPLVVLSAGDPVVDAQAVLRAGAAGFIPKSGTSKVMLQAIRLVLAGGQYLPPQLLHAGEAPASGGAQDGAPARPSADAARNANARQPAPLDRLSERQKQVFALLADGLSNKAIARRLGITEGTVKTHVATIFDLLDVHNRVAAVAAARAAIDPRRSTARD